MVVHKTLEMGPISGDIGMIIRSKEHGFQEKKWASGHDQQWKTNTR